VRKKSNYKPKGVRLDNMTWLMSGMRKVGTLPTTGVSLKLRNHEALDSILKGQGSVDHMDVLIACTNMAEALVRVRDDLGGDWRTEIRAAQDAIYSMGRRGVEKGSFIFTGPEMTAVKLVMDLHDVQLDNCTVKEMEQALDIVNEEIRLKKARPIVTKKEETSEA
jgi:hypothetical protein